MSWPPLDAGYTDEFGPVDPEVYRAAGQFWPQAERFARQKLGDAAAGMRLLFKAVAIASRRRSEMANPIKHLTAYIFRIYAHLVLAELKRINGRKALEREHAEELLTESDSTEDIERKILIEELCRRMDPWTRKVFELQVLGFGFEMMEPALGMKANAIRAKYSKQMKRLRSEIQGRRPSGGDD